MTVEALGYFPAGGRRGARLVNNDNVEATKQRLLLAKRLSNHSLYTVTCCRPSAMLLGDCQTQPRNVFLIAPAQHGEQLVATACCPGKHAAESRRVKEPVLFGEPVALAARQS